MLTQKEQELVSMIAADNESGGHLLSSRPPGYKAMRSEITEAVMAKRHTVRQSELLEYLKQCSDYVYYDSLPKEQKMF
jgi:hypothetical protein